MNYRYAYLLFIVFATSIQTAYDTRYGKMDERSIGYLRRTQAAQYQLFAQGNIKVENLNTDEFSIPDFAGCFTKSLEHDPITGVLTANGATNYIQLLKAIQTGQQVEFNVIHLAPGSLRLYENPQAGFSYSLAGCDSSLFIMEIPP